MVAFDKNELSIQPFFKLPVFLKTAFFSALQGEQARAILEQYGFIATRPGS